MPRKGLLDTDSSIAKRIKEGRGQGVGKDYKPWLYVQDVSSDGRSHRIYSHKTGRVHHLLSDLEKNVFLSLNWSANIRDIREQYPLKREDTLAIAKTLGIKHPSFGGTAAVMSSDFFVDCDDKDRRQFVLQVKYSKALLDPRTIEKLEIERRYWLEKGIPWLLVTERDIDAIIKKNMEWLFPAIADKPLEQELFTTLHLLNSQLALAPETKFIEICKKIDHAYNSELGKTLSDTRRLMANGFIEFDITKDFTKLLSSELHLRHSSGEEGAQNVANQ